MAAGVLLVLDLVVVLIHVPRRSGTDCGPSLHTFRTRLGQCNNNQFWPNSFMAPAMDLPNNMESGAPAGGVHLMDKITIAQRLVSGAVASVYLPKGFATPGSTTSGGNSESAAADIALTSYGGPHFLRAVETTPYGDMDSTAPRGSQVVVHFSGVGENGGIEVRSNDGFELNSACGWGGSWVPATIVASNASSVTLQARSLIHAVGVRYLYADTPCDYKRCAVYSAANALPLAPFQAMW